ncbi:S1 family peptidase [Emcibacter nanhaiensis]|uniref:Trypsin-like peptidase domain-containing protein n=1 Tax=Emcibacter nanhaiensis TaxID=1505037 RepID=A0A501PB49_9PROT|nr:serine protease [Emcibacter nanhaiensis]TPD57292.1 trypsin-like peptidase domain-containing protein [Emcibacter nanhaiensis]
MNWSTKFALFLLFIVVIGGELSKPGGDNGLEPVPPMAPAPRPRTTPVPDQTPPAGQGRIRRPSPDSPVILIQAEEKKKNSIATGTAFAVRNEGYWITARHVTEGCGRLLVMVNDRQAFAARVLAVHPTADVSLLSTAKGFGALALRAERSEYDQEGFHFGFPRGEPGDVYSRLIGQSTMVTQGSRFGREPVLVWAEKIRNPAVGGSLGGISGGPILDRQGHVAGIHVAGSVRRGRSYSSQPGAVLELMKGRGLPSGRVTESATEEILPDLNSRAFAQAGAFLRKKLIVAKVVCIVGTN